MQDLRPRLDYDYTGTVYSILNQGNALRVGANVQGKHYADYLGQYQFTSLLSFILAMVLWLIFVCTLVNQNIGVLKKPFFLERGQKENRRASCSSICVIAGLILTLASIAYAICISDQIYDQTLYVDKYEEERQKKLRQLHYKF